MYSLRKWIFRPKRSDLSLLAGFFYADEELNMVATELDSFDGRKDPERCTALVNQLRLCQDKVLTIIERIMEDCVPEERASRDFRVKFPDDVLQESLAGQLWFGAECLAAGSSIMNREVESASMRPLAKALSRHLDYLRSLLRDQCLRNINAYTDRMKEALILFDRLFAEFELSYVSAMVPVKTMKEYDVLQDVIVLFSETTQRAQKLTLLTQDMVDDYDPALMFTIPRLAIVCGLLVYPEGPLNPDMDPVNMSEMFRPFQTLLYKIRELLWTLSKEELWLLEKSLCSAEEPGLYRENGVTSFPVDFDPYEDLPADRLEFPTDGAAGPPSQSESADLLGIDQSDYGCMSQSPSTMTIVANPDYQEVSDDDSDDRKYLTTPKSSMKHQDSSDSGMLSENTSISETMHAIPSVFENPSGDSRSLRHSVSWPEPTRRTWRNKRFSDSDTTAVGFLQEHSSDGLSRTTFTHHGSSHEFNFHLPYNTELSSGEGSSNSEVPTISVEQTTPHDSIGIGSTRVFFTTDSNEGDHCCQRCTRQISYVTETLNEVFVTDTSFQPSLISSVTSKTLSESVGFCCKCGTKTCGLQEPSMGQSTTDKNEVNKPLNVSSFVRGRSPRGSSRLEVSGGETSSPLRTLDDQSPESEEEKSNSETLEKEEGDSPGLETGGERQDNRSSSLTRGNSHRGLCGCTLHPGNCDRTRNLASGVVAGNLDQAEGHEVQPVQGQSVQELLASNSGQRPSVCRCGNKSCIERESMPRRLGVPRIQRVRYMDTMTTMCSACRARSNSGSRSPSIGSTDVEWDRESYASSETSSYNSDCQDDEEIALAIQAAELASRREARSRFKSPSDLIHRLFVCISGVADQLQTNYASDLRHILKAVFECNSSEPFLSMDDMSATDNTSAQSDPLPEDLAEAATDATETDVTSRTARSHEVDPPPHWVPDEESPHCESCEALFTFVRRRHHCRNCGKIFCGRCSSNAVPLPHYGHTKPVRVCNHCFMFQVTPFTVDE